MERDSHNENFERFLRYNANNLRMHGSDKVWKNISKEMTKRRRRISFTLAGVIIATSTIGYFFITNSIKPLPATTAVVTEQTTKSPGLNTLQNNLPGLPVIENKSSETTYPSEKKLATVIPIFRARQKSTEPIVTPESTESTLNETPAETNNQEVKPVEDIQSAVGNPVLETNSMVVNEATKESTEETEKAEQVTEYTPPPFTIESVTNSYKAKKSKIAWQLSFTPTVSYRKLGENKSYMREVTMMNAPSNLMPLYSVNSAVTHKPDMGFEVGVSAKYRISKGIRITSGIQFNVNRYDIKAFEAPFSIATIRLNGNSGPDSVRASSTYSTTSPGGGYHASWLQNLYFQVSAPIGVELKLSGTERTSFGIATSVQPTYVIGDRAYLITSGYKGYAEVPWLVRRWNVNTNLQTFVTYSTGKTKWQVGPQVRYQLLSSFISKYPVKENLFDFGLKVGISLNNQ